MTRRGIASFWAVVILAVVSVMTTALVSQFLAIRRGLDTQQSRKQAEALLDAGWNIAFDKLRTSAAYRGEKLMLLPNGEIIIEIAEGPGNDVFQVRVVSHYPVDQPRKVKRQLDKTVTRKMVGINTDK